MKIVKAFVVRRETRDGVEFLTDDVPIGFQYFVDLDSIAVERWLDVKTRRKTRRQNITVFGSATGKGFPIGRMPTELFLIEGIDSTNGPKLEQGDSIECKICKMRSYSLQDAEHRYCGNCKRILAAGEYKLHTKTLVWEEVDTTKSKHSYVPAGEYPIMEVPSNALLLGRGILTWHAEERRSNRYGFVYLTSDEDTEVPIPVKIHATVHGTLMAKVLETRVSEHVGDQQNDIYPRTPILGSVIPFGTGTLCYSYVRNCSPIILMVGVQPDDKRTKGYLNTRALYDLHQQTVQLYLVPTQNA